MIYRSLIILCLLLAGNLHAGEIQLSKKQAQLDIRWQDTDGNTHHLKDSTGKPRLLHFWAAWCSPCRHELPQMLLWQEKNSDIQIIPLSLDDRIAQTRYFIEKYKLSMSPLLLNKDDSEALEIPALPFTIFVSADGSFSAYHYGIAPWGDDTFSAQVRAHFKIN